MARTLSHNWWAVVIRGVLGVAFGVVAIVWPGITATLLVLLFAAYALVDGVFAVAAALSGDHAGRPWWALLVEGLFGVAAGVIAFAWPGLTAIALVWLVGVYAVATGIAEIIAAVRLRRQIAGEVALAVGGVLSVLFGLAMFFFPGAGLVAIVWIIGVYAIVFG